MKLKTRFFLFMVAVLFLGLSILHSTSSKGLEGDFKNLIKKTLLTIQDNNFSNYKKLRPTVAEITALYQKAITNPNIRKRMIANYKIKERYSLRKDRRYFRYAVRMCKNVKIDWKTASIYSITPTQFKENIYYQKADLYFQILSKKRLFKFKLDDCVKINDRWVISDGIRWLGMTIEKK